MKERAKTRKGYSSDVVVLNLIRERSPAQWFRALADELPDTFGIMRELAYAIHDSPVPNHDVVPLLRLVVLHALADAKVPYPTIAKILGLSLRSVAGYRARGRESAQYTLLERFITGFLHHQPSTDIADILQRCGTRTAIQLVNDLTQYGHCLTNDEVRQLLSQMAESGHVRKSGRGAYRIGTTTFEEPKLGPILTALRDRIAARRIWQAYSTPTKEHGQFRIPVMLTEAAALKLDSQFTVSEPNGPAGRFLIDYDKQSEDWMNENPRGHTLGAVMLFTRVEDDTTPIPTQFESAVSSRDERIKWGVGVLKPDLVADYCGPAMKKMEAEYKEILSSEQQSAGEETTHWYQLTVVATELVGGRW